ncbi:hypothetical protein [Actinomadura madurae]|uniref:hypothetical protein n=1 Tax=Actinomadura madurae TaxID=1993 RepID=UPI0020D23448|nr:hypothetical protein [Actinomadura madurae]
MGKRNPESYPIRDGMEFGAYTFGDQDFGQIKEQLKKLRPEAVGDASTAYKDASDVLAEMTGELRNNFAKRIVQHWQGDVAQEALDQLGQVYETSGKLSDDSHNNAQLYNWYKTNILDWYKTTGESMEDGYVHTGGDDDRARELIEKFSRRMKEAFDGHPLKITKDLPTTLGDGHDKPPGGPGPGGGPGGLPGGGPGGFSGSGSGLPTSDPAGAFKPGGGPSPFAPGAGSPFNPGSDGGPHLPGGGPGAGGAGFGSPGTDLSSFPGGGPPGGGPGLGGGGGGFGADPGGFGGAGSGGGAAGGPGGAFGGGGAGMGAAGRGAAAGMRGMGGMPMAPGAGQGGKDEERERNTWLTEDEDVWGADDDTAPPVIG